jgi:hypothetical protein
VRWPPFCPTCWGNDYVTHWEAVPLDEVEEWQLAELMVNGGEMRRAIKEPCPACSTTTK